MTDWNAMLQVAQLSGIATVLMAGLTAVAAAHLLKTLVAGTSASHGVLRFSGLVLIAVSLLGGGILLLSWVGFFGWLIILFIWWRAAANCRAVEQRNLLAALALAAHEHMPLSSMVSAFAAEQEGGFAARVRAFAALLRLGFPLTDAIRATPHTLPPEAALALQISLETGDLSRTLAATTYSSQFDRSLLQPLMARMLYLFPVLAYFVLFMVVKIAPSMVKIFDDFGAALPPVTVTALRLVNGPFYRDYSFSGSLFRLAFDLSLVVLLCLPLVYIALGIYIWLQWRGTLRPRLPVLKRIVQWVNMAFVLRMLSLACETGRPLPGFINTMARLSPKRSMRKQLRAVGRDINNGLAWTESLRRQHLLTQADAAILSAAEKSGNPSWALREMAASFERRANYRLQAVSQVVLPLVVLPIGACTALFVIGFFAPLPDLIRNLS